MESLVKFNLLSKSELDQAARNDVAHIIEAGFVRPIHAQIKAKAMIRYLEEFLEQNYEHARADAFNIKKGETELGATITLKNTTEYNFDGVPLIRELKANIAAKEAEIAELPQVKELAEMKEQLKAWEKTAKSVWDNGKPAFDESTGEVIHPEQITVVHAAEQLAIKLAD